MLFLVCNVFAYNIVFKAIKTAGSGLFNAVAIPGVGGHWPHLFDRMWLGCSKIVMPRSSLFSCPLVLDVQ